MHAARTHLIALFALVAVAVSGAAPHGQSQLPPPFPRTNATRLLENDRIVIWDVVWPNGQPTALHRHIHDQVGTYYARGGRTITSPEGVARRTMTEIGALSNTRKGTTHIEMGNTDPPLHAVFIELRRDGPSGAVPAANAGNGTRVGASQRSDDERVRVWDYIQSSGEFSYRAATDTVIVYLGEGRLRLVGESGTARDLRVVPGTMRYVERGTLERETLVEGAPRAIAFELK